MKTFEEFKAHFKENVHEKLEGLEQRRLQMHNRRLQVGGIVGILVFFHWIGVITGVFYAYTLIVTVIIFPVAGVFFYRRHFIDHTISDDYKEAVVKEMVGL